MQSLRDIAPYLALGASVLALVLLALVVRLLVGQRRLRRAQLAVLGSHGERDLVAHAQDLGEQVRNLRDAVQDLDELLSAHRTELDKAFTRRAIVRYDAFRDIGGEQSASIALLDNNASGLVISMIHSRDYARIYVKQLRQSVPDRALSPEEVDVVEAALAEPASAAAAGPVRPPSGPARPPLRTDDPEVAPTRPPGDARATVAAVPQPPLEEPAPEQSPRQQQERHEQPPREQQARENEQRERQQRRDQRDQQQPPGSRPT